MIEYDESKNELDKTKVVEWLRSHAPDVDKDLSDKELFVKLKPAYVSKAKQDLLTIMQATSR